MKPMDTKRRGYAIRPKADKRGKKAARRAAKRETLAQAELMLSRSIVRGILSALDAAQ